MVRRFRGEGVQKVDGKGRVSIPANYRSVLRDGDPNWSEGKAPEFVIVYGDAGEVVAEFLGGRIELASEPGRGSTFTLVLPEERIVTWPASKAA